MKYFYIITRDKNIHELEYIEDKYKAALNAWNDGKIIFAKSKSDEVPYGINSADVTQILPEEKYSQWIKSSRPKKYLMNGSWYDGRDHELISHTAWKEAVVNERTSYRLESKEMETTDISPERWNQFREELKEMFPFYKWGD